MIATCLFVLVVTLAGVTVFGRVRFPRLSRLCSLSLLVAINLAWLVFAYHLYELTASYTLAVLLLLGWAALQWYCHDSIPRPRCRVITASREATADEKRLFEPTLYFRVRREHRWSAPRLEIDDAIDIPDAEIVPVMDLSCGAYAGGSYIHVGGSVSIFFEHNDRILYGRMHLVPQ